MDNWDEIRTAFHVARQGTVSGAAEALGVHHATVIRHIDALEGRLGVKLFQRHARGYAPTEAGQDLLQVAQATNDQFAQLQNRIKGRSEDVEGDFLVTTLVELSPKIMPALVAFQQKFPNINLNVLTDARLFRLEYGEAHAAIRAGAVPSEPDNVVRKLMDMKMGLYAAPSYVDRHGVVSDDNYSGHKFVGGGSNPNAPHLRWLNKTVTPDQIVVHAAAHTARVDAVLAGAGIGFLSEDDAMRSPDIIQVANPDPAWFGPIWLVTHVDLHRTAKVQAFVQHIADWFKD